MLSRSFTCSDAEPQLQLRPAKAGEGLQEQQQRAQSCGDIASW